MFILKESEGYRLGFPAPTSYEGKAFRGWLVAAATTNFLEGYENGKPYFYTPYSLETEDKVLNKVRGFFENAVAMNKFEYEILEWIEETYKFVTEKDFQSKKLVKTGTTWKNFAAAALKNLDTSKDKYLIPAYQEILNTCNQHGVLKGCLVQALVKNLAPLGLAPAWGMTAAFNGYDCKPEWDKGFWTYTIVDDTASGPIIPWSDKKFFAALKSGNSLFLAQTILKKRYKFDMLNY